MRARLSKAEGLIAAFAYGNSMVCTGIIRATGRRYLREIGKKAVALFSDSGIAFDRRIFATNTTEKSRHARAGSLNCVGVLCNSMRGATASNDGLWWNTIVAASGVLTEINLNAGNLCGNASLRTNGRIYAGNKNPLQR